MTISEVKAVLNLQWKRDLYFACAEDALNVMRRTGQFSGAQLEDRVYWLARQAQANRLYKNALTFYGLN